MRTLLITAALVTVIPSAPALAQSATDTQVTTTIAKPAPITPQTSASPPTGTYVPPVQPVPSSDAAPGAVPSSDGVIRQWGPQQPVVEGAPAAPQAYPLCTHGRTDSCRNPNPAKELPYYPAGKG